MYKNCIAKHATFYRFIGQFLLKRKKKRRKDIDYIFCENFISVKHRPIEHVIGLNRFSVSQPSTLYEEHELKLYNHLQSLLLGL